MVADSGPDALSTAIVEAVAAAEGIDPQDVSQPLGEVVDADALDGLFRPRIGADQPTEGRVMFTYGGYEILVHSDGRVELTEALPAMSPDATD